MPKSRKAIKAPQGEQRALHATPVTGYLDTVRGHGVRDASRLSLICSRPGTAGKSESLKAGRSKPFGRGDTCALGGEGGIRTLNPLIPLVSCRMPVAHDAAAAENAMPPCPILPDHKISPMAVMQRTLTIVSCMACSANRLKRTVGIKPMLKKAYSSYSQAVGRAWSTLLSRLATKCHSTCIESLESRVAQRICY